MKTALRFHIRKQIILWSCIVALVYSAIASTIYLWGIDDSTEYYMLKEAKRESLKIAAGGYVANNSATDFSAYYLGYSSLPSIIQDEFPEAILVPNQSTFYENNQVSIYVLPYRINLSTTSSTVLYVVHRYDKYDDDLQPGMPLPELLIMLIMGTLLVAYIASSLLVSSITKPLFSLLDWARSLESEDPTKIQQADANTLRFSEFSDISEQLYLSIQQVMETAEREKQFLNATSHEIRTPLSVIFAALDILDRKDIPDAIQPKLMKIRRSSTKIQNLTESLLWLWRDENLPLDLSSQRLHTTVQDIISDSRLIYPNSNTEIHCDLDASLQIIENQPLLEVAIGNLIRNAIAYSPNGIIHITGNTQNFSIKNNYTDASRDSGFNIGLYIVKSIANKQQWGFSTCCDNNTFTARISWTNDAQGV
ncbi:hypothetical protein A9Q99_22610 [Gammaproteobacteria bacterium 45_16_T64]|nr:hypothetical protein A9Q99_22610 [Gammaproteobacteria bacterium 45_16_T64]